MGTGKVGEPVSDKPKFTITVDCEKWLRGTGNGFLLNDRGLMCCLGFACKQLDNSSDDEILYRSFPRELRREIPHFVYAEDGTFRSTELSFTTWPINDDQSIDDFTRMEKLCALARAHGGEFVFINQLHVKEQ